MPIDDYYKSFSFRLIGFDVFLSTITVFVLLYFIPKITDFEALRPFREAVEDFDITDIYFSKIKDPLPPDPDILIINTSIPGREGIMEISDKNYLQIIEAIAQYEPKAIGINHYFDLAPDSELYQITNEILTNTPNIVLATKFNQENGKNTDKLNKINFGTNIEFGFNNYLLGKNKQTTCLRKFDPYFVLKNDTVYHYGVKLAEKFNKDASDRFIKTSELTERINFRGNFNSFNIINAIDIVQGNFEESQIRNKIVMLGVVDTTAESDDFGLLYFTPLNEINAGRTYPDMYETIVDANVVSMLLTDEYYDKMATWKTITFAFTLCFINMMFFGYVGYRFPKWYEITALLTFMIETFGIAWLTVYLFNDYKSDSNFTLAIVAIAVSIPMFELYTDTIKPFFSYLFLKKKSILE